MQVDERFFATLMALNGRSHEVFQHAVLMYEDWTRVTIGGHPHDWDPEEVHTGLLRYAREQHDCKGGCPCLSAQTKAHDGNCIFVMLMHAPDGKRHGLLGWLGCCRVDWQCPSQDHRAESALNVTKSFQCSAYVSQAIRAFTVTTQKRDLCVIPL